jgi:hypothetical protein
MGFKTDTSFLRFLTMGALATQRVMDQLAQLGFAPIELERYASSNKIWATKIKRLRLPDLLCIRTGMRVEVRAKSNLEIRMSHAANNPERHWDAGNADTDIVALVPCCNGDAGPVVASDASFFTFGALRQSVDSNQLSRLKAASEGSEQHLTWPTIVAKRPGVVLDVTPTHLSVEWTGNGKPPRRHTPRRQIRLRNAVPRRDFHLLSLISVRTGRSAMIRSPILAAQIASLAIPPPKPLRSATIRTRWPGRFWNARLALMRTCVSLLRWPIRLHGWGYHLPQISSAVSFRGKPMVRCGWRPFLSLPS